MFPAWVSKLKDLKGMKSNQKQSKAPFLLPSFMSVLKSLDTDASAHFTKTPSLQKANIKSHCAHLEGSLQYLTSSTDIDSICNNDAHTTMQPPVHLPTGGDAATSKLCSYGSDGIFNAADVPSHDMDCKESAFDFHAMSGCGIQVGPHSSKGKKRMVLSAHNDLYGAIDNDTEGSNVLTPNTIESSFGSESSSANSSMVRKCGYEEESRQRLMLWQEGDCLGSLERGIEASVYPEEAPFFSNWQDQSSSEDLQSVCSVEKKDMSRLSFALNSSKFLESTSGSVCSLDAEAMSRLTYNKGHLNWQEKNSQNVADNHSLLSFYECHSSAFHASRIVPGCAVSMGYEGSPSFTNSSFLLTPTPKEDTRSCPHSNGSSVNSNMQQENKIAAGDCSKEECKVSIIEDIKASPGFWKERSVLEGTMLSYSEWEERSAMIAVENPGLMLSSKWHENLCTLQNQSLECSAGADQNSDLSVGQDNTSGTSICVPRDSTIDLSMCVQQGNNNGLSVCFHGNAGFHKSIHDAYLRRGRRHRGSSFSADLPKDLQGVVGDSMALVKMSHNPYEDFRHSMYEMIMEKDLEESMDVEELLYCYLSLNSPEHHELIEEVFSDVWSSILMSVR